MDELRAENKVELKYLSMNDTKSDYSKPMVVVTPSDTLNTSFAQYRLVNWGSAKDNKNLLLLCAKTPQKTISNTIMVSLLNNKPSKYNYIYRQKIVLTDKEMIEYKKKKEKEELELKKNEIANEMEEIGNESDNEEDTNKISELEHGKYTIPQYDMYDFKEEDEIIDDYGMEYNNKLFEKTLKSLTDDTNMDLKNIKIDPSQLFEQIPMKTYKEDRQMEVNCQVIYLPMDNRCFPKDAGDIISQNIKPNKLIIIHGNDNASQNMAADIYPKLSSNNDKFEAFLPKDRELVELTTRSAIIRTKIEKTLTTKPLKYKASKECAMGFITCDFDIFDGEEEKEEKETSKRKKQDLIMKQKSGLSSISDCDVYVSEKELPIYKINKALSDKNIKCDIKKNGKDKSEILCNNSITVTITMQKGNNQIYLDGPISLDYYKIKDILLNELHPLF